MIFVISHLKSFKRLPEKVKGGEDYQLVARKHKVSLVDRNILINFKKIKFQLRFVKLDYSF